MPFGVKLFDASKELPHLLGYNFQWGSYKVSKNLFTTENNHTRDILHRLILTQRGIDDNFDRTSLQSLYQREDTCKKDNHNHLYNFKDGGQSGNDINEIDQTTGSQVASKQVTLFHEPHSDKKDGQSWSLYKTAVSFPKLGLMVPQSRNYSQGPPVSRPPAPIYSTKYKGPKKLRRKQEIVETDTNLERGLNQRKLEFKLRRIASKIKKKQWEQKYKNTSASHEASAKKSNKEEENIKMPALSAPMGKVVDTLITPIPGDFHFESESTKSLKNLIKTRKGSGKMTSDVSSVRTSLKVIKSLASKIKNEKEEEEIKVSLNNIHPSPFLHEVNNGKRGSNKGEKPHAVNNNSSNGSTSVPISVKHGSEVQPALDSHPSPFLFKSHIKDKPPPFRIIQPKKGISNIPDKSEIVFLTSDIKDKVHKEKEKFNQAVGKHLRSCVTNIKTFMNQTPRSPCPNLISGFVNFPIASNFNAEQPPSPFLLKSEPLQKSNVVFKRPKRKDPQKSLRPDYYDYLKKVKTCGNLAVVAAKDKNHTGSALVCYNSVEQNKALYLPNKNQVSNIFMDSRTQGSDSKEKNYSHPTEQSLVPLAKKFNYKIFAENILSNIFHKISKSKTSLLCNRGHTSSSFNTDHSGDKQMSHKSEYSNPQVVITPMAPSRNTTAQLMSMKNFIKGSGFQKSNFSTNEVFFEKVGNQSGPSCDRVNIKSIEDIQTPNIFILREESDQTKKTENCDNCFENLKTFNYPNEINTFFQTLNKDDKKYCNLKNNNSIGNDYTAKIKSVGESNYYIIISRDNNNTCTGSKTVDKTFYEQGTLENDMTCLNQDLSHESATMNRYFQKPDFPAKNFSDYNFEVKTDYDDVLKRTSSEPIDFSLTTNPPEDISPSTASEPIDYVPQPQINDVTYFKIQMTKQKDQNELTLLEGKLKNQLGGNNIETHQNEKEVFPYKIEPQIDQRESNLKSYFGIKRSDKPQNDQGFFPFTQPDTELAKLKLYENDRKKIEHSVNQREPCLKSYFRVNSSNKSQNDLGFFPFTQPDTELAKLKLNDNKSTFEGDTSKAKNENMFPFIQPDKEVAKLSLNESIFNKTVNIHKPKESFQIHNKINSQVNKYGKHNQENIENHMPINVFNFFKTSDLFPEKKESGRNPSILYSSQHNLFMNATPIAAINSQECCKEEVETECPKEQISHVNEPPPPEFVCMAENSEVCDNRKTSCGSRVSEIVSNNMTKFSTMVSVYLYILVTALKKQMEVILCILQWRSAKECYVPDTDDIYLEHLVNKTKCSIKMELESPHCPCPCQEECDPCQECVPCQEECVPCQQCESCDPCELNKQTKTMSKAAFLRKISKSLESKKRLLSDPNFNGNKCSPIRVLQNRDASTFESKQRGCDPFESDTPIKENNINKAIKTYEVAKKAHDPRIRDQWKKKHQNDAEIRHVQKMNTAQMKRRNKLQVNVRRGKSESEKFPLHMAEMDVPTKRGFCQMMANREKAKMKKIYPHYLSKTNMEKVEKVKRIHSVHSFEVPLNHLHQTQQSSPYKSFSDLFR